MYYWDHLNVEVHKSLAAFMDKYGDNELYFATTHGMNRYTDVEFGVGSYIIFGKETRGLPKELIEAHVDRTIIIPMGDDPSLRSLNLSNTVAIVLYEALRQRGFPGMI